MSPVLALHDGSFPFDPTLIDGVGTDPHGAAARLGLPALPETVEVPVYAYLLHLDGRTVLIDTGAGDMLGPGLGGIAALPGETLNPATVDVIALTHLHGDHCGGLLRDGGRAFPNARLLVPEAEVAFWLGGTPPAPLAEIARDAARALAPYTVEPVGPGWEGAGLTAWAAPGHTPGHMAWVAPALGVLACGDLWHITALQADDPARGTAWDIDGPAAATSRAAVLAEARHRHLTLLGAHTGPLAPHDLSADPLLPNTGTP